MTRRRMVRAVIFDIDGTLNDWDASIGGALREVLPHVPSRHRDELADRLRQALAEHAHVLRDGVVVDRKYWLLFIDPTPPWRAALPDEDPETVSKLANRFRSALKPVPYSDAEPALASLRGEYSLGVLSNNPHSEQVLADMGLRRHFDAVVAADDPWRKPHPEAFQRACEALSARPGEAVYLGDSLADDVEGALGAGLIPVWMDRYGENYRLPAGATRIASLDELPALLAAL